MGYRRQDDIRKIAPRQVRYALGTKSGEGRTAKGWNVISQPMSSDVSSRGFHWRRPLPRCCRADETGHQAGTLEKAMRLPDMLREIAREPLLSERLVLKGGTALSVFHLGLDQLSPSTSI